MNLFAQIKVLPTRVKAWWQSLYDGAQRWGTGRSSILTPPPQDARYDITQLDRDELVRKSRYFEANNPIANRMGDLYEQFVVGPNGLPLIPSSSDPEWNQRATEWFNRWAQTPDLCSKWSLSTLQTVCARREFFDGQILILKTRGEDRPGRAPFPRVQLIETHRIGTPGEQRQREGVDIVDGWEIDARGRPVAVWIKEPGQNNLSEQIYRRVTADQVIVVGEPCRPGQFHSLPYLYPVINDLHDLDDLQKLTMQKAKENAAVTRVLKNAAGEMPNAAKLIRERLQVGNQNSSGTDITEERTRFMQKNFGARGIAIKTGEEFDEFVSNTPSVAEREFWSLKTAQICIGVGIPKLLVLPESMQGTVVRGEYDIANAFFRSRSAIHAAAWIEVWLYVMQWGIDRGFPELAGAPADWRNVEVVPPRAVNVDVGYNATAVLTKLDSALTTYRYEYALFGQHWMKEIRQVAREASFIDQVAKEEGTTPERIRSSITETLKAKADLLKEEKINQENADAEEVAA